MTKEATKQLINIGSTGASRVSGLLNLQRATNLENLKATADEQGHTRSRGNSGSANDPDRQSGITPKKNIVGAVVRDNSHQIVAEVFPPYF